MTTTILDASEVLNILPLAISMMLLLAARNFVEEFLTSLGWNGMASIGWNG